jgi:hypothetical protein
MPGIEARRRSAPRPAAGWRVAEPCGPAISPTAASAASTCAFSSSRIAPAVGVEIGADLGGDGEAGRHRQAEIGHLGEVGALAAEQWMLFRQGYDRRAWWVQILLAWVVLAASWLLTPIEDNINWVHGLGEDAEQPLPPLLYLGLYMALLPVVVIAPMHYLLKSLFRR